MRWVLVLCLVLIPCVANAQQQQKPDPVTQGLILSVQQVGTSVTLYLEEMQRRLVEKDARIIELIKLCGEPCKEK